MEVPDVDTIAALKSQKVASRPSSGAGSPAASKSLSAAASPAPDRTESPVSSAGKPSTGDKDR